MSRSNSSVNAGVESREFSSQVLIQGARLS